MNLRQIEVFHAVYSTGSVSKAAALLNVSQPSISKVLRHTEDVLGFLLFERVAGRLIPTKEAKDLSKNALRVQSEIGRLNMRVRQISEDKIGSLRLAMTPGIGLYTGPRALAIFHKQYPAIALEIETLHFGDAVEGILENRIDLAVVYQPFPHPGIKQVHLIEGEFVCVSSAPTTTKQKIKMEELHGKSVIALHSQAPLGRLLTNQLEKKAPAFMDVVTVNTYHIAKSLAAEGVGHAIVDEITAKSPPTDGLSITHFTDPLKFNVMAIFQESKLLSAPERSFLDVIRQSLSLLLTSQP